MLELAILTVIAFAAAYSLLLWKAGRQDDVLHGAFIQTEVPSDHLLSSLFGAIKNDLAALPPNAPSSRPSKGKPAS